MLTVSGKIIGIFLLQLLVFSDAFGTQSPHILKKTIFKKK
jgi:hypothetical protein